MTTNTVTLEGPTRAPRRMRHVLPQAPRVSEPAGTLADALARLYALPVTAPTAPTAVPPESTPATAAEQRGFPRRMAAGFVSLARSDRAVEPSPQEISRLLQTSGLTGELQDLSRSGLALVLLQPLVIGEAVVVRLSQLETDDTLDTLAEVVRCVDLGDQRWKITTRFAQPLGFDEAYEFAQHELDTVNNA